MEFSYNNSFQAKRHNAYVRCIFKYLCIYNMSYALRSSSYAFWSHCSNKRGYNNKYLYMLSNIFINTKVQNDDIKLCRKCKLNV